MRRWRCRHSRGSSAPNVVVADDLEDGYKMRYAQKLPNRLPNVEELQSATRRFCGNVQPNQRAQARAVHVGEIREVQHDSFGARNQLADLQVEAVAHARHQAASASHCDAVAGPVNCDGQGACGGLFRHPNLPSGRIEPVEIAAARLYTLRSEMEQGTWSGVPVQPVGKPVGDET